MGQDTYTSWKEFELASDLPSRRGSVATSKDRANAVTSANSKVRGIAGELVAAETPLPDGLQVRRRVASDSKESTNDYERSRETGVSRSSK